MAAKKTSTRKKDLTHYGADYADIPDSVRAEVKQMVESFKTTPQICYGVLCERRRELVCKVARENQARQKEDLLVQYLRDGTLRKRRDGVHMVLMDVDALAELLEMRLDLGRDGAAQSGIRILREKIERVSDHLGRLLDLPSENVDEEEVAHG